MGSSSSSAQKDNRNAVGEGGLAISGNNSKATLSTVTNITDGGSVKAALEMAIKAQELAMNSTDKAYQNASGNNTILIAAAVAAGVLLLKN